ncbi:MAG TPA: Flp pilus assembly protein CpaB [Pseudolabrys sp.]|nr:Flp pilus assembly protein CpaB [Pseudolabrys sp.]
MKAARLVVLTVALAAGGVAALLASRSHTPPAQPQKKAETVDILVAKNDIPLGQSISGQDVKWQSWPVSAASGNFIRRSDRPQAIEKLTGSLARSSFVAGEPIRDAKLVDTKGSGFMAAILPSGMRAISTQISAETGAGGFILPNDHVDVILTRRDKDADKGVNGGQTSETILSNVRVLAIDQTIQEKNGQKVVVGKTATLELTQSQAESLALARQLGMLSLALRSMADASHDKPQATDALDALNGRRNTVNVVRFGVSTTSSTK